MLCYLCNRCCAMCALKSVKVSNFKYYVLCGIFNVKCIITRRPRKSASLPFSMRDTKKPMENSRPPRIAKPNDVFCWVLINVRRDVELGRHSRTIRIRGVRLQLLLLLLPPLLPWLPPPPTPLLPRNDVASLELVEPWMLLQSVMAAKRLDN